MEPRIGRSDPLITLFAFVASVVGIVAVWDAGYSRVNAMWGAIPRECAMQFIYFLVAIGLGIGASRIPGKFWLKSAPYFAVVAVGLLALVETKFGKEIGGARRWIAIGPFSAQPAEFAKLACVLLVASALSRPKSEAAPKSPHWHENADAFFSRYGRTILSVFVIGACFFLFEKESDMGTAAVLAVALVGVMVAARTNAVVIIAVLAILGLGGLFLIKHESYRGDRLANFEHRWDPGVINGPGYQTTQSEFANALGGVKGVGLGAGEIKRSIPAATTDFLLATIAEEFGFLGVAGCILLIGFISVKLVWKGLGSKNLFGGSFAAGLGVWIGVQAVTNVLMVNGHIPPVGIPLPFLSAGGSSLMAIWLGIGISESLATKPAVSLEDHGTEALGDGRRNRRTRLSRA